MLAAGLGAGGVAGAATRADVERQFQAWLADDLRPAALAAGVPEAAFRRATAGIALDWDLPDLAPPGMAPPPARPQSQAEFRSPGAYFSESRLAGLAAGGRTLASKWAPVLAAIERTYGVPGRIVLAVWGRESGYGRASLPKPAITVLATKAFMSTRRDLFRAELIAALEVVARGDIAPAAMKGSWAGALGQPQFMPSSYLKYAVDFDGDGRRDIWNSVPDTLASIANYLMRSGWVRGRDWGYEVALPDGLTCALEGPDKARPLSAWVADGVRRINGKPFPASETGKPAMILVPAGVHGPAFLVTPNFYVLKEYNTSDLYALFIGNLADRIGFGAAAFRAPWGEVGGMLRSDVAAIQAALEKLGYDVGGADGLPGYKTRRSIGDWQAKAGTAPTCFPEPRLIGAIR